MGKRVDYAARSVICPDMYINTNEIGIPMVRVEGLRSLLLGGMGVSGRAGEEGVWQIVVTWVGTASPSWLFGGVGSLCDGIALTPCQVSEHFLGHQGAACRVVHIPAGISSFCLSWPGLYTLLVRGAVCQR